MSTSNTDRHVDVYTRVTEKIIADLEKGVRTWMKPWSVTHTAGKITRPLRHGGIPYQGVNVLLLWSEAGAKGYVAPIWMTYKQAVTLGAHVRKGERATMVVYADRIKKTEIDESGAETEAEIPFLKAYSVFNVDQIEGLPHHYYAQSDNQLSVTERIAKADEFIAGTGVDIRHGGNAAFYTQDGDRIQIPPFESFKDAESYYGTALHELTHWTKHPTRLNRDFGRERFGDNGYAREELVAELGAAFLCADIGFTPIVRDDHAAYLQHWVAVLKTDKRAIFSAAAHAQRAADYLTQLQPVARERAQAA
jgi:antirestriction protein ArdC